MRGVLLLSLVVVSILAWQNVAAECMYYGSGDWNVYSGESCTVSDTKITLSGNLTIYGSLTLRNVTIIFKPAYDGEFGINVADGGTLIVSDGSNFSSAGANYFFYVSDGAKFNMTDSYLSDVGWKPRSGSLPDGIRFRADGTYFSNNTVYAQLVFERAHGSVISHNTIIIPASAIAGAAALSGSQT